MFSTKLAKLNPLDLNSSDGAIEFLFLQSINTLESNIAAIFSELSFDEQAN